jgi:hypothetical protein
MTYRKLIPVLTILILVSSGISAQTGRWEKNLSGKNWNLWLDVGAQWYNDDVYLPPVDIAKVEASLGNASSKEITSALSPVPFGNGTVTLSTLNLVNNFCNNFPSAVVAKKLFLNVLEY